MENDEAQVKIVEKYHESDTTEGKSDLEAMQNENSDQENLTAINTTEGFSNSACDDRTSLDSTEQVITTQPNSQQQPVTYEDTYRTGNFGITIGKVSQTRGLKWALVHMGLTVIMLLLTVIGTALLAEYYNSNVLRGLAVGFTWSNSIVGVLSGILAVFFFRRLTRMKRPYAFLMAVRFMAIINWVLLLFSLVFVPIIIASKGEKAFSASGATIAVIKTVYILFVAALAVEMVVSFSFVCSPVWSDACDSCSCCGACCIYTEGEEIAPGVPNPPSQERWQMVALVLREFHEQME